MKLDKLSMVNRIDLARDGLKRDLVALVSADFALTIRANRQDEAMMALVRPRIETEIRARIAALEADLAHLGVDIGHG